MCGLGTNQVYGFGNCVSLNGANVPRYRLTYESKPDSLTKGLGSDPFTIHCKRIEAAKEGVSQDDFVCQIFDKNKCGFEAHVILTNMGFGKFGFNLHFSTTRRCQPFPRLFEILGGNDSFLDAVEIST